MDKTNSKRSMNVPLFDLQKEPKKKKKKEEKRKGIYKSLNHAQDDQKLKVQIIKSTRLHPLIIIRVM
jgi:hypothetical protein